MENSNHFCGTGGPRGPSTRQDRHLPHLRSVFIGLSRAHGEQKAPGSTAPRKKRRARRQRASPARAFPNNARPTPAEGSLPPTATRGGGGGGRSGPAVGNAAGSLARRGLLTCGRGGRGRGTGGRRGGRAARPGPGGPAVARPTAAATAPRPPPPPPPSAPRAFRFRPLPWRRARPSGSASGPPTSLPWPAVRVSFPPPPRPSAAARGGLGPARPSASLARRPSAAPALPEPAAPGRPRPGGQTRRLQRTPPAPIRPGLPAAAAPPPRAPAERGGGTERPLQNANAAAGGGGGGGLGLGSLPGGSSWPTHTQGGFTHASRHTRGGAARAPGTSSPSRRFQAHAPPPPDFPEPFSCPPTPFLANPARGNGSFPRRNQRLPRLPPPPRGTGKGVGVRPQRGEPVPRRRGPRRVPPTAGRVRRTDTH